MKTRQTLLRWTTGLLSAGGAFFLAACYGPQRPVQRPMQTRLVVGTVECEGQPVEGVAVCDSSMPDQCPLTDARGRFEIRYEDDGLMHKLCTQNAVPGAADQYSPECFFVKPGSTEITISVQKLEQ